VGCTSLEGMIYQEKKLEQSECVQFSADKYKELMGFFRGVCLTHGQFARMADIESQDGLPSLQKTIFDACMNESDTNLEALLFNRYDRDVWMAICRECLRMTRVVWARRHPDDRVSGSLGKTHGSFQPSDLKPCGHLSPLWVRPVSNPVRRNAL